jgi:hypothetical protein
MCCVKCYVIFMSMNFNGSTMYFNGYLRCLIMEDYLRCVYDAALTNV